ncbi:maleate cis-trans isomerase [Kocuria aegyptia]|uniref:Aspartate/glutamate racemase family protein n=1 Tax=Kocuria aegyptia TaxID=330943 RepID=A0ABN2KZU8_9MICC
MHTVVMLYPGHSAEDDYEVLERLVPDAAFPVVRTWEGGTAHDVEALLALGSRRHLEPAARRARAHVPDAVLWACTSGSFVHGREGARAQADWVGEAGGAPASSTSWAFSAAVRHLGVHRVAVAATYPADVADRFTAFLAGDGIAVTALSAHGVPSGEDAGRLDAEWLFGAARAADVRGAECLLVPDTALHTVAALPGLERALGLPVLTANQVTAWHGLRLAGHPARADRLGALFRS